MRKLRILTFVVVFLGFFLAGLSIGRQFEGRVTKNLQPLLARPNNSLARSKARPINPAVESQPRQPPHQPTIPVPATPAQPPVMPSPDENKPVAQNNILLVGVDDLESPTPRLESAWLILYITQTPHFTLMPIYPDTPPKAGKPAQPVTDLAKLFQDDPQGPPGPDFFSELKARGLWWSGYILIDRQALSEIIDRVSGLSAQGESEDLPQGAQAVARIPFAGKDPQVASLMQAEIAQQLCKAAGNLNADHINELEDLFLLYTRHIQSDIDREQAAAELVGMLVQGSRITCEFPTLASDGP